MFSGKFRKFDYGFFENLIKYGQSTPPAYDLSKVTAPVALYYSSNDLLAAIEDVDQLYHELSHVVLKYKITLESFNHLDFLWAIDINSLLHDRVIDMMDRYSGKF